MSLAVLASVTTDMAREMAVNNGVCVRPVMKRVYDRETGAETRIPIACGATREAICPPCARKARVLRMQQCAEGWHRDSEPNRASDPLGQGDEDDHDHRDETEGPRRVRSTRRRQDATDLPQVPMANRTVGRTFATADGKEYRPSMFLTLTLPSYGTIRSGSGVPVDPSSYDYRQAALDALHFPKLVDRFWQNVRRCAGYKVQYFAALEPQARLAPHLHAAMRGVIPRAVLRQVIEATYVQVWWPPHDRAVYVHRQPVWTGDGYCDPDTGAMLPTWQQALDQLEADPDAKPAHVMRFGRQYDMAGIIAPSEDADRAVRYLAKYLTKAVADPIGDQDNTPAREAHIDRLHAELRWLPCSSHCANWLRYGIQPDQPGPGLAPGRCASKAHDREHLGCGGRRVLVSRDWSGKTLAKHKADRATVVRQALDAAGMLTPDLERMAADVLSPDGLPRFIWTDDKPDPTTHTLMLLKAVAERQRWRAQYDRAKTTAAAGVVDNRSATGTDPPDLTTAHGSASPDDPPRPGPQDRESRVSAANPQDTSAASALDARTEGPTLPNRGRPSPQAHTDASRCQSRKDGE